MESIRLDKNLQLICVRAASFPTGIKEAFEKLRQRDPSIGTRTFYGISHGSENGIVYWAAVEEAFEGEGAALGLEPYTLKKGVYATETLENINSNEDQIGQAFGRLLKNPKLDRYGECIERYKNEAEVLCMVRLTE
jgi:hypothetical protein